VERKFAEYSGSKGNAMAGSGFAHHSGFTLVEVLVVATIIGVLAIIAIPIYNSYVTSAYDRDARSRCEMIGAAVMQRHNQGLAIAASSWNQIGITNPSDNIWTYSFQVYPVGADVADYTITATAVAGGPRSGRWDFKPYQSGAARWQHF
jgi:prepilin-type N-terminal cleavage/methylation domain-containing protein